MEVYKILLLEYHQESGSFHYNPLDSWRPYHRPDINGWGSVAVTWEVLADIFTDVIYAKNNKRGKPLSLNYVKKEWKFFRYITNSLLTNNDITEERISLVKENFKKTESIARLGSGFFSDYKIEHSLKDAWDYNPLSFEDSNF